MDLADLRPLWTPLDYLDPNAARFIRGGKVIADKTNPMLWVQAIALILSIVIGMMAFTASFVAVLKLHGNMSGFSTSAAGFMMSNKASADFGAFTGCS